MTSNRIDWESYKSDTSRREDALEAAEEDTGNDIDGDDEEGESEEHKRKVRNANPEGCNQYKPCEVTGGSTEANSRTKRAIEASKKAEETSTAEDHKRAAKLHDVAAVRHGIAASDAVHIATMAYGSRVFPRTAAGEKAKLEGQAAFESAVARSDAHMVASRAHEAAYEHHKQAYKEAKRRGEGTTNVFCPTGAGGGVDASCSPGGKGSKAFGGDKKVPGEGTKDKPFRVGENIKLAAKLLAAGHHVELAQREGVSTLTSRMSKMINKAVESNKPPPKFDLCKVSVPGTNVFCQETKGVPRVNMPQMRGQPEEGSLASTLPKNKAGKVDVGKHFIKELEDKGIGVEHTSIRASYLRASQSEIDGARVVELVNKVKNEGKDLRERPIYVTKDNYVLDGHHHWAALVALGGGRKDYKIPVVKLDVEIGRGISEANAFAKKAGIKPKSVATATTNIFEDALYPELLHNVWSDAAREAALAARLASKEAHMASDNMLDWADKSEKASEYIIPAREAKKASALAVKLTGEEAREYHNSASYEHSSAAEAHRNYAGKDARHDEVADLHEKAAELHTRAARITSNENSPVDVSNDANFRSEQQRKYLWAEHPDIAEAWAHGEHTSDKDHKMPGGPGADVRGPMADKIRERAEKRKKATVANRLASGNGQSLTAFLSPREEIEYAISILRNAADHDPKSGQFTGGKEDDKGGLDNPNEEDPDEAGLKFKKPKKGSAEPPPPLGNRGRITGVDEDGNPIYNGTLRKEEHLVDNPFVSEAQRRACHAANDPDWDCDEWEDATDKKLPERIGSSGAKTEKKRGISNALGDDDDDDDEPMCKHSPCDDEKHPEEPNDNTGEMPSGGASTQGTSAKVKKPKPAVEADSAEGQSRIRQHLADTSSSGKPPVSNLSWLLTSNEMEEIGCNEGFASDGHRRAFFGHLASGKIKGSPGGKSKAAASASEKAGEGSACDPKKHDRAAKAHEEAGDAHREVGDISMAMHHEKAASEHRAKAAAYSVRNSNPEGHNQYTKGGSQKEAHEVSKDAHQKSKDLVSGGNNIGNEESKAAVTASRKGDSKAAEEAHTAAATAHDRHAVSLDDSAARVLKEAGTQRGLSHEEAKESSEWSKREAAAHRDAATSHRIAADAHRDITGNQEFPIGPEHEASKKAASASVMSEHEKSRGHALEALDSSAGDNSAEAIAAHLKAANQHERAATKARVDGDEEYANQHDESAALHRKAASLHEARIKTNMARTFNASQPGHLEGADDAQRKAAFAAMAEEDKGGAPTKEALSASQHAEKTGTAGAHKKAAKAHGDAAEHHEDKGNSELAGLHKSAQRSHTQKAGAAARSRSTENSWIPQSVIANCSCEETRRRLISLNARKKGEEDDDDEDDSELETYAGDDDHSFDTKEPRKGGAMQVGGKGTKEEYNNNSRQEVHNYLKRTNAPAAVREILNNALKVEEQRRHSLAMEIVDNAGMEDNDERNRYGHYLMSKPESELLMMHRMLVGNKSSVTSSAQPIFTGASAAYGQPVDNSFTEDDVLTVPTLNFAEIAKENSNRRRA